MCSACNLKYPTFKHLNDHFKINHRNNELELYCPFESCVRQKYCKRSFQRHLKTHFTKEKFSFFQQNQSIKPNTNIATNDKMQLIEPDNILPRIELSEERLENDCSIPTISTKLSDLLKNIKANIFKTGLNIYSHPLLPMSAAEDILKNIEEHLIIPFTDIISEIEPKSQNLLQEITREVSAINTEYKFIKTLERRNLYSTPSYEVLNEYFSETVKKGKTVMGLVQERCIVMDIEFQIKTFLETPGILDLMKKYTDEQINCSNIESYISGEHWAKKAKHNTFAIEMFTDEFEVNDPLGSKTGVNSLAGYYYSFPNLPPYLNTRLKNIFVALIVESKLLKEQSNVDICSIIIEKMINKLSSNGIEVKFNDEIQKIFLKLGLWKGDNLGLNKSLGFSPGFNANCYCRFCKIKRKEAQTKWDLNGVEARNIDNYNLDLEKSFFESGIAFETKLNNIENFHATDNPFCDKMHDYDEGVAKNDIENLLTYFVMKKKYFTLNRLNFIKKYFNYGQQEVKNRSCPFKYAFKLVNKKRIKYIKVKTSASQMVCLIKYLPLMLKSLVPEKDLGWKFLLIISKLSDLLNKSSYSENDVTNLRRTITNHHKMFRRLFPTIAFTPKFHFLLHYPDIIKEMGPPRRNNCYMYEMKHKDLKKIARSVMSRKFLALTIAKKVSIQDSKFKYDRQHNTISEFSKIRKVNSILLQNLENEHEHLLLEKNIDKTSTTFYKSISFRDHIYKIGDIIGQTESTFYRVTSIIKTTGKYFLTLKELITAFDKKSSFYKITGFTNYSIISFDDLKSFPLNEHNVRGSSYIKCKFF